MSRDLVVIGDAGRSPQARTPEYNALVSVEGIG
jgi:hypothetical protein